MTDPQGIHLPPNHQAFVSSFVSACQNDDRVIAAFLGGSNVKGKADQYSDIDLTLITSADSFDKFFEQRESFLQSLGELVFFENFDIPNIVFFIFADDTEGELYIYNENQLDNIQSGPFHILIDKKNILMGRSFPEREADPSRQTEKLRQSIYWFWHEMSHFIKAVGRGQLWWARGQLEQLRSICVNLARLQNNFSDDGVGGEPYFKIEDAMPIEKLAVLEATFPSMEKNAMLQSAQVLVQFYAQVARSLAQAHGVPYPQSLETVMLERLEKLSK